VKTVAVLGATGSIGTQALEIISQHPGLRAVALSAHRNGPKLCELAAAHGVSRLALTDAEAAVDCPAPAGGRVFAGEDGLLDMVRESGADIVLNAIVGSAGLRAALAALESGADLALANKESLVAGGPLVTRTAKHAGRRILPVDSEHSALWQCLAGAPPGSVDGLVLTASGGPFRGFTAEQLGTVTPAQALRHPTWSMGAKITVDSATLMNKGLELIEAHELFAMGYDRIEIVVHPQSTVHAMVRFRDGALLAHLGEPDMRVPISFALTYPERAATPARRLDLSTAFSLDFMSPDLDAFPALRLAREAGEAGGTAPCALNAANEVAVQAFLDGKLRFTGIAEVVARVLDGTDPERVESLEQVLDADRRAREAAEGMVAVAA
jgi:1-deoxy-D-xylulose-5-phosphate reductoisomerase